MRLRNWVAVTISVILLLAAGIIGLLVNRSALQAADTVHRSDTRALGVNNSLLAGQLQNLSAQELSGLMNRKTLTYEPGSESDQKVLEAFSRQSTYFGYGISIHSRTFAQISASREDGLPPINDPGFGPIRPAVLNAETRYAISSIMFVGNTPLEAVAVPVRDSSKRLLAVIVGYIEVAETQLQTYTQGVAGGNFITTITDSTGRVAAASQKKLIGSMVAPSVISSLQDKEGSSFVEYKNDGTDMIAIVVRGMPGGWAYVRTQTKTSFDGAVRARNQTLNLTLLAMVLIGLIGISLLGYRSREQRRRADERFQALFQHAPDIVAVLDTNGRLLYASPSAGQVLGLEAGSMKSTSVFELVHPQDREDMQQKFDVLMGERDGVMRLQTRVLDADGRARWFEFTASNQLHNPALNGVVVNARDVTENRTFQEQLAHEALHDSLTGLPNRRRMQDALGNALKETPVAVLFVDLDGFKPVNDAYGHQAGDELLRQVGQRLSRHIRDGDVLARVGGDEFVLLMPGVTDAIDADAMSTRIRDAITTPFYVLDQEVTIGASVGVHMATSSEDPDEGAPEADDAMYAIKRARGKRAPAAGIYRMPLPPEIDRQSGRHRADM